MQPTPAKTHLKRTLLTASLALTLITPAQAQLFGDDQARQAIIDLRNRLDQAIIAQNRLVEENTQLRRSLLEMQQSQEQIKTEVAQIRGQQEETARETEKLKTAQTDQIQLTETRLSKLEASDTNLAQTPAQTTLTGQGSADERPDYEKALAQFKAANYPASAASFNRFIKQYPNSTLAPSALFWLGNSQYAISDYKTAIQNFRALLTAAPSHPRAPEALLAIANCQIELKDKKSAKSTLQTLLKNYPQAQAAQAAKDRLNEL